MTPKSPAPGNTGHGHVRHRPDGVKARCGGPAICSVCALELAQITGNPVGTDTVMITEDLPAPGNVERAEELIALRAALRNMADAYVRKVKTGLTDAEIAKEPWRCMEYIEAERLCIRPLKLHFTKEWLIEKIKNDPDLPCEVGPLPEFASLLAPTPSEDATAAARGLHSELDIILDWYNGLPPRAKATLSIENLDRLKKTWIVDKQNSFVSLLASAEARGIERAAKVVPTNWLDEILTGENSIGPAPYTNRQVEDLLRRVQDRIRALVQP